MKNPRTLFLNAARACWLTVALAWAMQTPAAQLINFPFNEGSGSNVTDTASGLIGWFGPYQNPAIDFVLLADASPSGSPGDRCVTNSGGAFLLADDSVDPVLNITNQPFTIEAWIWQDFASTAVAQGIVAYGGSWKMG